MDDGRRSVALHVLRSTCTGEHRMAVSSDTKDHSDTAADAVGADGSLETTNSRPSSRTAGAVADDAKGCGQRRSRDSGRTGGGAGSLSRSGDAQFQGNILTAALSVWLGRHRAAATHPRAP